MDRWTTSFADCLIEWPLVGADVRQFTVFHEVIERPIERPGGHARHQLQFGLGCSGFAEMVDKSGQELLRPIRLSTSKVDTFSDDTGAGARYRIERQQMAANDS
jgi:hypothetical protein